MTRRAELARRVGWYRFNSAGELARLAEVTYGEQLRAAVYAVLGWQGWLAAATDRGLYLSRRPRVFGRERDAAYRWSDLRSVRAGATGVDLDFGAVGVVSLRFIGPRDEFVALLEAARGPDAMAVDELRELARVKLGKTLAFGYESTIDGLPDRLAPGERVERVAVATIDFTGLLVVTGERVLLLDIGLRGEQQWELERSRITSLALDGPLGLRLNDVLIRDVVPEGRRDELAAVLEPAR